MLSQTAEYALRAMVYLAKHATESLTARDIAEAAGIPASYLSVIMRGLARAGIVRSQRGKNGGFYLDADSGRITLADVVQAVDPLRRITTCPKQPPDACARLCPLHRFLDEQVARFQSELSRISLDELLGGSAKVFPGPLP